MTRLIAICGTMGSGKTTAVENIVAALPNCVSLHEDDYNRTTERSLDEIEGWWARGAHVEEFDLSALLVQLAVHCPDKQTTTAMARPGRGSRQIILLETHFGRLHPELEPWIDLQYWIEVPADVALARKVAQLSRQLSATNRDVIGGLQWIEYFCNGYLTTTRKLFDMQRQKVRSQSELSIDGQASPLDVCSEFLRLLPPEFRPE